MKQNQFLIYGIHTCREALRSEKFKISKIFVNAKKKFEFLAGKTVIKLNNNEFNDLFKTAVTHQGVAMEVELLPGPNLAQLENLKGNVAVAILDQINDPHNFGAIIRSAAAFNVNYIIVQNTSSCKISGTVAKTASGGLNYVNIIEVSNLSCTIEKLKQFGFWVVVLDEAGDQFLNEIDLSGKVALVLGAEGRGVRRLQKERADFKVKLPTSKKFSTLNVSNAAAIAFYEVARQNYCQIKSK